MESFVPDPEQQVEEILVREGFAEPEDLEPGIAGLLKEASRQAREEEDAWMIPSFSWILLVEQDNDSEAN